jgi:SAM-dependent methyltransferase
MVYTAWRPTPGELDAFYANYPVRDTVPPVTIKRYDELLDRFEPYRVHGRMIDVGCGAGLFLERAALRGWETHGTEYGAKPVEACRRRGIRIIEGALDPANYPPGHFDVVCSFEVLEHLADPGPELDRMLAILRPGGLLYITTPNFNGLSRWVSGPRWNVVNYPEHLSYFTPHTLRRLAQSRGLEPLWSTTTGFSVSRWRMHRSATPKHRRELRRQEDILRERIEGNRLLRGAKALADALLGLLGRGDALKAAFRKPAQ